MTLRYDFSWIKSEFSRTKHVYNTILLFEWKKPPSLQKKHQERIFSTKTRTIFVLSGTSHDETPKVVLPQNKQTRVRWKPSGQNVFQSGS